MNFTDSITIFLISYLIVKYTKLIKIHFLHHIMSYISIWNNLSSNSGSAHIKLNSTGVLVSYLDYMVVLVNCI